MNRGHMWAKGVVAMVLAALALPAPLGAQDIRPGLSVRDLPRPGYETGRWQAGNTIFLPVLTAQAIWTDNVFATSTDPASAVIFGINPRIDAISRGRRLTLETSAYANVSLHSRYTSEDRVTFGLGTAGRQHLGQTGALKFGLRLDRGAQARSDPESSPTLERPALYNSFQVRLGAEGDAGPLRIGADGTIQKVNYLASGESDPVERARLEDQDLTSYQLPVRIGWRASPRLTVFVEPFVNRRDARLPVDRTGIDRDLTTWGAQAGAQLDIADRWNGSLGIGAFRSNPDDPSLSGYSGFSMSGNLVWSPDPRTRVLFTGFSGDVATVRSGATGRIDTRAGVRIEQEIRHNLLAFAGIGWRQTRYRGSNPNRLWSVPVEAEVEWLMNRTLSLFGTVRHENRRSDLASDRFRRTEAGIGIRVRT